MASSQQTPPISGEAPPTPEHTPPPSSIAPPTPQQTPPTPEQIPPTLEQVSNTSEQAPPTSNTSLHVDFTYKLVVQQIDGGDPTQCSNLDDHISIKTDNITLNVPGHVLYHIYCDWSGYHGDANLNYHCDEDTFDMVGEYNELKLQHGNHGTKTGANITSFSERTKDGERVKNGGRYVRMDVKFATAGGSPARSAKVWGKRVIGNETSGIVTLSEEERLRLGIEEGDWTWRADR